MEDGGPEFAVGADEDDFFYGHDSGILISCCGCGETKVEWWAKLARRNDSPFIKLQLELKMLKTCIENQKFFNVNICGDVSQTNR